MLCDSCKYFAGYCKSHHWDIDGIVIYCGRYCYSENPKNKAQSEHLNKIAFLCEFEKENKGNEEVQNDLRDN